MGKWTPSKTRDIVAEGLFRTSTSTSIAVTFPSVDKNFVVSFLAPAPISSMSAPFAMFAVHRSKNGSVPPRKPGLARYYFSLRCSVIHLRRTQTQPFPCLFAVSKVRVGRLLHLAFRYTLKSTGHAATLRFDQRVMQFIVLSLWRRALGADLIAVDQRFSDCSVRLASLN